MPLVSLPDLKDRLGITGTADDVLLASCASNASVIAARDTGRIFAVSSNVTRRYSTDGQASLTVVDMPYNDDTRVVTLQGAEITQDTNYWLLPDRRNPDVATTIQVRFFDRPDYYKSDPNWWDKGLDRRRYAAGSPNDLVITGVVGHPAIPADVAEAVLELAAWLYYKAKAGASAYATAPDGTQTDLADYPPIYRAFVDHWRIRTGVGVVGG